VEAFLDGRISFYGIPEVIEYVMDEHVRLHGNVPATDIETILHMDAWARHEATTYIARKFK